MAEADLKRKTAQTLKWNAVDRVATQVLYAVTGVVLANLLSKEDFGLVGVMLVFQAFAQLFVDSGFSSALIQKKSPTDSDYCTVLYFNMGISVGIYIILWFAAPLIADFFGDPRLTALSRVMFLSFIVNASAIVQTNRLMKQMTVGKIVASNSIGLTISGAVGIILAIRGFGAWAIVWQTISLAAVRSAFLWLTTGWLPRERFSRDSLRSVVKVGTGVMTSSFLNTLSLNIYSFIIGRFCNLATLGCYTQADKWSKMGVTSLTQILTNTFLPILSNLQNDAERWLRAARKMNRFAAYLSIPAMLLLIAVAEPVFHILFGTKWDDAILLFQILAARGIFVILTSLYNHYLLALGRSRALVVYEIVKDSIMILAIVVTIPFGIEAIVWGQFAAAVIFYFFAIVYVARHTDYRARHIVGDATPYAAISIILAVAAYALNSLNISPWLILPMQLIAFAAPYILANRLLGSTVQKDAIAYLLKRK